MRTVPGPTGHVVVVGAGLSGLSAALYLLGAGRHVTVLERDAGPGGRAGRIRLPGGYLVDTGPTVLTMPEYLDEALAAVGESLADRVELLPLHPAYRARFADGSHCSVHTEPEAMAAEVRRLAGPAEEAGYRRLRRWLTELYRVQRHAFIDAAYDSPLDLLTGDLARLAALGGLAGWDRQVRRFLRDERLRRLFTFQALYAGVAPRRARAAYAVIAYMDTVAGVFFPRGGMHAVPRALAAAAQRAGATLRYRTRVTAVERSPGGRAAAVHTADGVRVPCDALVLTCELAQSLRLLGRAPRRLPPLRYAPSAVVLHAATRRSFGLDHHTLFFGRSWERAFRQLTRDGELPDDPSLLVTCPTVSDPTLAPPGGHLHYVLAPCPNLRLAPHDWTTCGPRFRDRLVAALERRGLVGLDAAVVAERLVTPADWAAAGHPHGTPFSVAHTLTQTGPFRPRNLVDGWENVVLAGCGTTPGVGVPPVVLSGKLAAARVTGAVRRRPATRRPSPVHHRRATGHPAPAGEGGPTEGAQW